MLRKAAVAGSWYPGSAGALSAALEAHLARVPARNEPGALLGLVVPHAGLMYSGAVAAHAYALLRGRRDLSVVLVGPSHHAAFEGVAVQARGAFETPLGRVPIDEGLANALLAHAIASERPAPHVAEHSLEMQLPFLQHLVPGVRIVPALMGRQGRDQVVALRDALASLGRAPHVLFVASSDLSHYHPAGVAHDLDAQVVARLESFDAYGLTSLLEGFEGHACGGGPIASVMGACRALGGTRAKALNYADSGDAGARDKTRVVGYLAAGFWAAS